MIRQLKREVIEVMGFLGVLGVLLFVLSFLFIIFLVGAYLHTRNAPCEELMYLSVKDLPVRCLGELTNGVQGGLK